MCQDMVLAFPKEQRFLQKSDLKVERPLDDALDSVANIVLQNPYPHLIDDQE